MFTGLIEDVGAVRERHAAGHAGTLEVQTLLPVAEVRIGESVAVNGACLTVARTRRRDHVLVFHTLSETLRRTNLGSLQPGALVNLERALCLGDRLGGHFVQGHVDDTARITALGRAEDDILLRLELPEPVRSLVIPKGSIAVNGISLTVARLLDDAFEVRLIPHTWEATNLRTARVGDRVNLETDMLGKYVQRFQETTALRGIAMTDLEHAGFMAES